MRYVSSVGIASYYLQQKRKRREKYGTGKNSHLGPYKDMIKEAKKEKLEYKKYPWAAWWLGFLFFIVGLYLIYHLTLGKYGGTLFPGFTEGYWWQYLISAFSLTTGLSFIIAAETEVVLLSKEDFTVTVMNKSLFGSQRILKTTLEGIKEVQIVKRGIMNATNDTTHYKILLVYEDNNTVEMLESHNRFSTKQKYIDIKIFLGHDVDLKNIEIFDQSENMMRRNKKKKKTASNSNEESKEISSRVQHP